MAAKRKRECCRIKDRSPLGLLGIFLITAGVIIAIFAGKDTLPDAAEPYVIATGVVLSILGVVSIVLAFMGYRRSRTMARDAVGLKLKGGQRRHSVASELHAVTLPPKHDHQPSNIPERTGDMNGPALVALPDCYKVILPTHSEYYISKIGGHDNYAFQQTHGKVLSCETLHNSQNNGEYQMKNSERGDQNHIHRIEVSQQGRNDGTDWSNTDVAKYIPPASTIV